MDRGLIEDAAAELGAAINQVVPGDDAIIVAHIRTAYQSLRAALDEGRYNPACDPANQPENIR